MQLQTEHCNDTRLAAKRVGEASAELFLGLFIGECGPISQPATVIQVGWGWGLELYLLLQVMDHSLDVLVLEMGVIKRVYVDRLGVGRHTSKLIISPQAHI